MNKAFKKYRCHYRDTRFAAKQIAAIRILRRCMMASAHAQGMATVNQILYSTSLAPAAVKVAVAARAVIATANAVIKAGESIQFPKWYKSPNKKPA